MTMRRRRSGCPSLRSAPRSLQIFRASPLCRPLALCAQEKEGLNLISPKGQSSLPICYFWEVGGCWGSSGSVWAEKWNGEFILKLWKRQSWVLPTCLPPQARRWLPATLRQVLNKFPSSLPLTCPYTNPNQTVPSLLVALYDFFFF